MSAGGRRLRNVRANEAIRAFEKLGYVIVRVRGSHYILRHPDKGLLVIPFHRGTVKVGVLLDALKKMGITPEEFEALR
ncbi:MAG: type II toxin-antitoxin system HicA family toxin [Chloroflexi bacterium]|nr:type II toxin-antitoxin system HicA family toxin [Chloroflexota bacterium]